jgi:hypothetical protein
VKSIILRRRRMKLPSWAECFVAVYNNSASPIQEFIYEQEPAGVEEAKNFRVLLPKMINYFWGQRV